MKWKPFLFFAAVTGVAIPTSARACDLYLNSMFHRIPTSHMVGAGLALASDGGTTLVPSIDLNIGLARTAVIIPAIGLCHESAEGGGEDFSELIYGGALGVKLYTSASGKLTINGQTGLSIVKYSEAGFDFTDTTIPIIAAGQYAASTTAGVFFGAGLQMGRFSVDDETESDSDPVFFGGLTIKVKRMDLSGGIGLKMGDDDTDMTFNFGLKLPLGGS